MHVKVGLKMTKRKKTVIIIVASVTVVILALGLFAFGFYWSKLDKLRFDDNGNDSSSPITADGTKIDELTDEQIEDILNPEKDKEKIEQIISDDVIQTIMSESEKLPKDVVAPTEEITQTDDIINVLLIATDESSRIFNNNSNSDCMIILSINKNRGSVKLISIERGIAVPIRIGQYAGEYEWINSMVRLGGPGLLQKTVEEVFRIDLAGYIRINPATFIEIVDSCGGVDINLTSAEAEYLNGRIPNSSFSEGMTHLDGKSAEKYSRCRTIDSDWGRIGRQRNVIQSAIFKAKGMSVGEINTMLNNVLPLVQTNLTKVQITELIMQVPSIAGKSATQMVLPKQGTYTIMTNKFGKNMFAVDFDSNAKALREFINN